MPPPPDDRLAAALDSWESWLRTEHTNLPPVLQAALAHYQFETIHPFADGNGRIGRLVVVLQLLQANAIVHPVVTVSPWFLRRREQYQSHLLEISRTGAWDPWVQFFSQAVIEQCERLISGAFGLLDWLSNSRRTLNERHWSGVIHRLLEDLFEWPVITIADAASRYGVSNVHSARMMSRLVEIGVLEELTGKSYGRLFGARFIMDTVDQI